MTEVSQQPREPGGVDDLRAARATSLALVEHLPEKPLTADVVKDITEQITLMGQLRRAVVSLTTPKQWQDFGGEPYMEADAALTIASAIGLLLDEPKYEWIDLGDGQFQCYCEQTCHRNGRVFVDHGDCDSFDDFFAKRRGELERAGATEDQIRRVLRVDAQKKARANAISRVVSGWTGLRGLSWDDLEKLGLPREKSNRVEFRRGSQGGKLNAVSIRDMQQLAVGSRCALRANIFDAEDKSTRKNNKPFIKFRVQAAGAAAEVCAWGKVQDWMVQGAGVFFAHVDVIDSQGTKAYWAKKAEQAEPTDDDERSGTDGHNHETGHSDDGGSAPF